MPEKLEIILVAYDIADPKRLRKMAKLCEAYGTRVQLSVFECQLRHGQLEQLQQRALRVADIRADRVRYYRICASDYQDIVIDGVGELATPPGYFVC